MEPAFWAKAHGATTHFPLALAACSAAFDAASLVLARRPAAEGLRTVGYWTMLAASAGTLPAVGSGLLMTHGVVMGHDLLRFHHYFIWPAFALLVGLGIWRALQGPLVAGSLLARYLGVSALATALLFAGAYWGGEMMLAQR